jgi:hypothetical protein
MRNDPPPVKDRRIERCHRCKSPALLKPGYCECGEPVCTLCEVLVSCGRFGDNYGYDID